MGTRKKDIHKLSKDREHLVLDNLNLVDWVIQKKLHIGLSDPFYEDYQQEGRYGLVRAAISFDEGRGFQFSTFAASYIMGCVQRFRRDFVRSSLKVPRRIMDMIPKVTSLYYEGYTYSEICAVLEISPDEVSDVLNVSVMNSLDKSIDINGKNGDDKVTLIEMIENPNDSIVDVLGDKIIVDAIETVAGSYKNPEHKEIWYEYIYPMYFGERVGSKFLEEKYKYSQPQISRILKKGKNMLREELRRDNFL